MTFKAIVGIVLGAMLANNYALEKFLGAAPLLGWSAQEKKITVLGVSVTVAMVLTALIAGLVQTYVLDALSLGYLQTLVFAAIVLIVVYAMNAVAKAAFKKDLGVYFPVIALNSAVLGLAVNNAADALSLGESILTALGAVITSLITGYDWQVAGATYVNFAMFFAFATLYPDAQVLLLFFIPVKIKWMAILDACYFAYIIFFCAASRYWIGVVLPLVALLNFFVFFAPELGRFAKREQTRTKQAAHFHNAVRQTQREQQSQGYRHKCAVCGRTDVTNPELQFRYCSKCAGYHCFCSDHIFNHVHFTDENP